MAGILVEYSRFVEVQQRRMRLLAELRGPSQTPAPPRATVRVSQRLTDAGASPAPLAETTCGAVDVR